VCSYYGRRSRQCVITWPALAAGVQIEYNLQYRTSLNWKDVRFRSDSAHIQHFIENYLSGNIIKMFVRHRVTRRFTRIQTICNVLKWLQNISTRFRSVPVLLQCIKCFFFSERLLQKSEYFFIPQWRKSVFSWLCYFHNDVCAYVIVEWKNIHIFVTKVKFATIQQQNQIY